MRIHFLDPLQVKLAHQGLVGKCQRLVQLFRALSALSQVSICLLQQTQAGDLFKLPGAYSLALKPAVELFQGGRDENALNGRSQLLEVFGFLYRDLCLLVRQCRRLALLNSGAGDGNRTRDQQLGRL